MNLFTRKIEVADDISADDFTTSPQTTFWTKWCSGMALPLALAGYAVYCCATRHALMPGGTRYSFEVMHLYGPEAFFFGLATLSIACLLHFHYFWTAFERLERFSELLKNISLLGFIGTFGTVLWLLFRQYFLYS